MDIPIDTKGKVEIYIDDGITVIPDLDDNRLRGTNAIALAIYTIYRPISEHEPVHREDCLSLSKLAEEGTLAESAVVLGWKINTITLVISLTPDKFHSWQQDIQKILENKKASNEELDTLIGRLNHASGALPIARYFLNRIRKIADPTSDPNYQQARKRQTKWIPKPALQDLQLFHEVLLPKIYSGISLNLLTYRRPSHILFSDTCPTGLGGYSINTGKAWRWKIPPEFSESVQSKNNILEFLAAVITIWVELLADSTPHCHVYWPWATTHRQ